MATSERWNVYELMRIILLRPEHISIEYELTTMSNYDTKNILKANVCTSNLEQDFQVLPFEAFSRIE